jgi:hypothetical protein
MQSDIRIPVLIHASGEIYDTFSYATSMFFPAPVKTSLDRCVLNTANDKSSIDYCKIVSTDIETIDFYVDWSIEGRSAFNSLGGFPGTQENPLTHDDLDKNFWECINQKLYNCNIFIRLYVRGELNKRIYGGLSYTHPVIISNWEENPLNIKASINLSHAIFYNAKLMFSESDSRYTLSALEFIDCDIDAGTNLDIYCSNAMLRSNITANEVETVIAHSTAIYDAKLIYIGWGNDIEVKTDTIKATYDSSSVFDYLFNSSVCIKAVQVGDDYGARAIYGEFWENVSAEMGDDIIYTDYRIGYGDIIRPILNGIELSNCTISGQVVIEKCTCNNCTINVYRKSYEDVVPHGGTEKRTYQLLSDSRAENCKIKFDVNIERSKDDHDCGVYDGTTVPVLIPNRIWYIYIFTNSSYTNCECTLTYKVPEFNFRNNTQCYSAAQISEYIGYSEQHYIKCETRWWTLYTSDGAIEKITTGSNTDCP